MHCTSWHIYIVTLQMVTVTRQLFTGLPHFVEEREQRVKCRLGVDGQVAINIKHTSDVAPLYL